MSYDVDLIDQDGQLVQVEHHEADGGTYVVGGTNDASLNITYNYGSIYSLVDPDYEGLAEQLDGKSALQTTAWLERMVAALGTHQYRDYWAPTPGNAGHALNILLGWAREHPDARWEVS